MAKDPGFDRYKNAILDCLSRANISDLEVKCSDGNIMVPGLVLASVCSFFNCVEPSSFEDCVLILPDLTREKVALFVRVLCGRDLEAVSGPNIRIIQDVTQVLRCSVDLSHCVSTSADLIPQPPDLQSQDNCSAEPERLKDSDEIDSSSSGPAIPSETGEAGGSAGSGSSSGMKTKQQQCTLNLAVVDLDQVTDEVLSDNYSDQEGRLVCLVCYKLHGPLEQKLFRHHVKEHTKHQLERMTITLPVIGKGGPGLRKKFLTDFELEDIYCDLSGGYLVCRKCDKHVPVTDKTIFRKHLTYHNLKEKNYVYRCDKCPSVFKDPSNLKRHVENIHEKQVFRCLHCDFEDNRKKRLEDHLINAHNDQVQCEEEPSLYKGEGSAAIADLTATNDTSLATFNTADSASNVFVNNQARRGPNILQKYSYQCTGCKFR